MNLSQKTEAVLKCSVNSAVLQRLFLQKISLPLLAGTSLRLLSHRTFRRGSPRSVLFCIDTHLKTQAVLSKKFTF